MFSTILFSIGGIFIGAGITLLYNAVANKTFKKKLIKSLWDERGTNKFGMIIATNPYGGTIGTIEVEELQSAGVKTKVRIIQVYINKGKEKQDIMDSISCQTFDKKSWVFTNTINWYKNTNQYMRDKRLDDILEKPNEQL